MTTAKKLISAAGAAGAGEVTYVDDVFSTYLYEGNGIMVRQRQRPQHCWDLVSRITYNSLATVFISLPIYQTARYIFGVYQLPTM